LFRLGAALHFLCGDTFLVASLIFQLIVVSFLRLAATATPAESTINRRLFSLSPQQKLHQQRRRLRELADNNSNHISVNRNNKNNNHTSQINNQPTSPFSLSSTLITPAAPPTTTSRRQQQLHK